MHARDVNIVSNTPVVAAEICTASSNTMSRVIQCNMCTYIYTSRDPIIFLS